MLREQCRVGMKVYFGRGNGEQTLGVVIRCNPAKAKVKQLEERGRSRSHLIGTEWSVPYSLMRPAEEGAQPAAPSKPAATTVTFPLASLLQNTNVQVPPPASREPLLYSPFNEDNDLLRALLRVYVWLSPENLCCDGEASADYVRKRKAELDRKKRGLELALGRPYSEGELIAWDQKRRQHKEAEAAKQ